MPKKSLSFSKALPYSSRDNRASFSVSINDLKCVPSRRRSSTLIIRLLINREATRNLPWIHFLPRQNLDHKNTNTIAEALGKDGSNIFPFTATLDKKILHDLLYIFLRETLTPLSTHIWWRKNFLCGFFPPSSFPSRYSYSQLTLISRKAFCRGNNLMVIFILWTDNQPLSQASSHQHTRNATSYVRWPASVVSSHLEYLCSPLHSK